MISYHVCMNCMHEHVLIQPQIQQSYIALKSCWFNVDIMLRVVQCNDHTIQGKNKHSQ